MLKVDFKMSLKRDFFSEGGGAHVAFVENTLLT